VLHQIRAHLAAIGAPVLGDADYGGRSFPGLDRFFLHAARLGLTHPVTGSRIELAAPLPPELRRALGALGLGAVD
jgi:23S rRNA pseudouridine1911/1915/1917 synthase